MTSYDYRNIDCMIGMKEYPDKYFDLAIVDPPYGINANNMQMGSHPTRSRNDGFGSGPGVSTAVKLKGRLNQGSEKLKNRILNTSEIDWDNEVPTDEYFNELFRISKNQIIWGGNYFKLPPCRGLICWNKLQPWDNFSQFELAWTSFDMPAKMFTYSNTGGANKEKKIHPTQKPLALYRWCLNKFSLPKQKILDTHAGSATSIVAALDLGMEITAFERSKKYFELSCHRIQVFLSQTTMFL